MAEKTYGTLKQINIPFEGKRWVVVIGEDLFDTYRTKKAAMEDARKYGIVIRK